MKIFDKIMDYYNYYRHNGYSIILPIEKIYYHNAVMKPNIIRWLTESCGSYTWNISFIDDNETGDSLVKMDFLHKEQAILFKLWLE